MYMYKSNVVYVSAFVLRFVLNPGIDLYMYMVISLKTGSFSC